MTQLVGLHTLRLRYLPLGSFLAYSSDRAIPLALLPSLFYTMMQPIQVPESISCLRGLQSLTIENAGVYQHSGCLLDERGAKTTPCAHTELGVQGLHHLSKLPSLRSLRLHSCGLVDAIPTPAE